MTDARTNEKFRVTRPWKARLERDHAGCRKAFEELLGAGCVEETLVWLLVNLQCSIGRTSKSPTDLKTLMNRVNRCARAIELFGQSGVSGVVTAERTTTTGKEAPEETTVWGAAALAHLMRQFAVSLSKQAESMPRADNLWESRALALLAAYVKEVTRKPRWAALDTLAAAVLDRPVSVRVRVYRFKRPPKARAK